MLEKPYRNFSDSTFLSGKLPKISIRLPEGFEYLGGTDFTLYQAARVDRHHFVDAADSGAVRRLVILHFERFLPGTGKTFNYSIPGPADHLGPDYCYSPEKIQLGAHGYIHNTWFFDAGANIRENPEAELVRTARLLEEHGYTLPEALQMSRYVRVVDEARSSELILFYMEPLEATGYRIEDFTAGGAAEAVVEALSAALTRRSMQVFGDIRDDGAIPRG